MYMQPHGPTFPEKKLNNIGMAEACCHVQWCGPDIICQVNYTRHPLPDYVGCSVIEA